MSTPFEIVNVFTRDAFAGNQLAVIPDARGLSPQTMQAIAKQFNFAESAFVLPPADPTNTAHVRIFTPEEEMPFAGHPNVGTGYVLARLGTLFGRPLGDTLRFEEEAGLVAIEIERRDGAVSGARVRAPRPLETGAAVEPRLVAEMACLARDDIVATRFAPVFASVGAEFLFAEVSATALERATPDVAAFRRNQGSIGQSAGLLGLHLHCRSAPGTLPGQLDVRMFAPTAGVFEDAATGSAAAALGALLHQLDPAETHFTMHQGRHIARASRIDVLAGPAGVSIGGDCAPFATGSLLA